MKSISFASSLVLHLAAAAVVIWFDAAGFLQMLPPRSGVASIELVASIAQQATPPPREVEVEIAALTSDVKPPRKDVAEIETERTDPVPLLAMAVQVVVPPRAQAADRPNQQTGAPELPRKQDRAEDASDAARAASIPSPAAQHSQGAATEIPPSPQVNPEPIYPREALRRRITGRVVLRVRVGRDGNVESASVHQSSGHNMLDQAAQAAVRRWQFTPARNFGVPVAQDVAVPIVFELKR